MAKKKETVQKHVLKAGRYGPAKPLASGEIRSEVITGFAIPIRAIFDAKAKRTALRSLLN